MEVIRFYKEYEKWGEFSNFYESAISTEMGICKTNEHYFQAMKCVDPGIRELVRKAETPMEAKKLAWSPFIKIRPDWEEVKNEIMFKTLMFKFTQKNDLRGLLLSTGDAQLIENAPNDYVWGCGEDGTGENRLGLMLMDVRRILSE